MNRTICSFQYIASWFFCALAGFLPYGFTQTLPPLTPVNVPNFTIPFEFDSEESANSIRDVELLVSKDRGKRWHSVARQPLESKKFSFRADTDGEYWFSFRTITLTGNVMMSGAPRLRVLVNTKNPTIVLPSQSGESGPLVPPKPARFRNENEPKPPQLTKTDEPETKPDKPNDKKNIEESIQILGPKLPGFEPPNAEKNREGDFLDDLLSGMSPFLDVQPVQVKIISNNQATADKSSTTPQTLTDIQAGGITSIVLNDTATKIIVRWNTGHELWHDAQIDILRSSMKEGPWSPIAINLPNNGEYWWFLVPEDLKPFYIAVQIRSLNGGIHLDITQSAITIDPKLAFFQHQQH